MHAAILPEKGSSLNVDVVDDPEPGPGDVLVRVDACGICGSDLHAARHLDLHDHLFGHEFCGTVEEVGPAVRSVRTGERVTAHSLATCGACAACLRGDVRKCPKAQMTGFERPGAYAELITVPANNVVVLPPSLDDRHGALIEPLAVALHTVERAELRPGDDAVVLGGGPVGLAVVLWLRTLGAKRIVVSDPVPHRRDLAVICGATHVVDPATEEVPAAVVAALDGEPPVVIECVGVPGLIQDATELAAVDGRVVVAGVCMEVDSFIPFVSMAKELDVRFAFYYRHRDYAHSIEMIAQGRLDPLPLVTAEVALSDAPARFDALQRPATDCKVLIRPQLR